MSLLRDMPVRQHHSCLWYELLSERMPFSEKLVIFISYEMPYQKASFMYVFIKLEND